MGIVAVTNFVYRGVPKELVLLLKDTYSINSFIETGTYLGETAKWAAGNFSSVTSFEASEELYNKLINKLFQSQQ